MARRVKKLRTFPKKKSLKPKHNWRNPGGERHKMLDMGREEYFSIDLEQALEITENRDNKDLIAATVTNKAARDNIRAAQDYVDDLSGDKLEPKIAEKINRLLEKYSTYR